MRRFKTFMVAMAAAGALAVGAWADADVGIELTLIPAEEVFVAVGGTIILAADATITGTDAGDYELAFQWYSCGEATCGGADPEAQTGEDNGLAAVSAGGNGDSYELTAGETAEVSYFRIMAKAVAAEDGGTGDSTWSNVITVNVVDVVGSIVFDDEDVLGLTLSNGTAMLDLSAAGVTVHPASFAGSVVWEVHSTGETGAVINGTVLTVSASGTAVIRASVENGAVNAYGTELLTFVEDFTVAVGEGIAPSATINITGQPALWQAFEVGTIEVTDVLKVEAELSIEDAGIGLAYQWFQCEIKDAEVSAGLTAPADPEALAIWLKNCAGIKGNDDWKAIESASGAEFAIPAELGAGAYVFYVAISAVDMDAEGGNGGGGEAGEKVTADAIDPVTSDAAIVVVYEVPEPALKISGLNPAYVFETGEFDGGMLEVKAVVTNVEEQPDAAAFAYEWFICEVDGENDCDVLDGGDFELITGADAAALELENVTQLGTAGVFRIAVVVSVDDNGLELEETAFTTVTMVDGPTIFVTLVPADTAITVEVDNAGDGRADIELTVEAILIAGGDDALVQEWTRCVVANGAADCTDDANFESFDPVEDGLTLAVEGLAAGVYHFRITLSVEDKDGEPVEGIEPVIHTVVVTIEEKVGILDIAREDPADKTDDVAVFVPVRAAAPQFVAGPSPVAAGNVVNFFWQNTAGKLRVFDASGRFVREVTVAGGWDLKDARGRAVPEGTYAVRGILAANDGARVRVSVLVTVVKSL